MTAATVLLAYVIFSLVELGWETLLTFLNMEEIRRNQGRIPKVFAAHTDDETYRKSTAYSLDRNRFSLVAGFLSGLGTLALVLSGFLGLLDGLVNEIPLRPFLRGIVYVLAVTAVFKLFSLPFSLYSQFILEEKYGFNKMTVKLYFADLMKRLLISLLLSVPLLYAFFWFLAAAGSFWWLWVFVVFAVFQLVVSIMYPLFIAPLFNKFSPLNEGPLKDRIEALSEKLAFKIKGVFVMDGSRRSRHSNAYFTGLGKAKRIVLFDTLLQSLTEDEIAAVLAHEIGHEKRRHLYKMMAVSFATILAGLMVIDGLRGFLPLYEAFGFARSSDHGILVILAFCSGPFTFFLTPLFTAFSRRHEYQADRFAAERGGLGKALKTALLKLGKDNLSNLTPHPWYSFYHYSHPSPAERLAALEVLSEQCDSR